MELTNETKARTANKLLPKAGLNGFDWTFVQGSIFVLRLNFCAKNPRLRQYPKRCGEIRSAPFATSARRLPPPDVPPLRGRRTSIGFAKFPHASKLAEETSQSRRAVGGNAIEIDTLKQNRLKRKWKRKFISA